ncbi:MAG: metallophosphoesterase [Bdellovibrionales bacterium]|nr:metallophosphoesterase [Bdellovibrionales bacterium]
MIQKRTIHFVLSLLGLLGPQTGHTQNCPLGPAGQALSPVADQSKNQIVQTASNLIEIPVYESLPGDLPGLRPFAILGDTQRTMDVESAIGREVNEKESQSLIRNLAREKPEFLVLLGDLTNFGASSDEWELFDSWMKPLRDQKIPVLPVFGNHDYWGWDLLANRNMESRFPVLKPRHWYSQKYGYVGMIFLDSNYADLTEKQWTDQLAWYESELKKWDGDKAVRYVLTFAHHAPYSNSTVTSDDERIQKDFVSRMKKSAKATAMINGHVHSYERFLIDGKSFVISGGGGGPRVELQKGQEARHHDLVQGESPRPFHYLWVTLKPAGLQVEVRGFQKADPTVRTIDTFKYLGQDGTPFSIKKASHTH